MKFRPVRQLLAEAMAEVQEFDGTWDGLAQIVRAHGGSLLTDLTLASVEPYTYDDRIGWNTHLVLATSAQASRSPFPVGYTDGPVTDPRATP